MKFPSVICVSLERVITESKNKTMKNNNIKDQDIKKDVILPGKMVSSYRYILRAPGSI